MKKYSLLIGSMLLATQLQVKANESFNSEMSHVVGGVVMAGGITAIVDHYYPEYAENRGMIGFGISSASIILAEYVEFALHGDARGQLLDTASHIAGSAFGAFVTDKYILSPVIKNSPRGGKSVGLKIEHSF
ncbi:MAG: hypothetical protein P794_02910 [Epsilonproteobacteria bacterium (ex Lamellibrachia satsuma)]|nr:MAG: hypothetical protein P794_02910 [Epsilonproteobacteria bacterium (ex Lamellibrachia satsuma)]